MRADVHEGVEVVGFPSEFRAFPARDHHAIIERVHESRLGPAPSFRMPVFRTIAKAALVCSLSLTGRVAASQQPSDASKQCEPRKRAQYASEETHTNMYAALVPARDTADAPAMYLATLLQEVQTAFEAPDTIAKLSDGIMSVWLHADGRLTDPRSADTLLPGEVVGALTAAIDSVGRRGWAGPVIPPLREDSVHLLLIVHYEDQRTPMSLPLFQVTTPPAFFEFQVEKPAVAQHGNPTPDYPEHLRELYLEGEVLAQFVISQAGRPEMDTFRVLRSDHPDFTMAVRQVLPRMRFHPAVVDGCVVRQLVQQPFAFKLRR
jgi:TonB family protein